jgi:hypothetical protein
MTRRTGPFVGAPDGAGDQDPCQGETSLPGNMKNLSEDSPKFRV